MPTSDNFIPNYSFGAKVNNSRESSSPQQNFASNCSPQGISKQREKPSPQNNPASNCLEKHRYKFLCFHEKTDQAIIKDTDQAIIKDNGSNQGQDSCQYSFNLKNINNTNSIYENDIKYRFDCSDYKKGLPRQEEVNQDNAQEELIFKLNPEVLLSNSFDELKKLLRDAQLKRYGGEINNSVNNNPINIEKISSFGKENLDEKFIQEAVLSGNPLELLDQESRDYMPYVGARNGGIGWEPFSINCEDLLNSSKEKNSEEKNFNNNLIKRSINKNEENINIKDIHLDFEDIKNQKEDIHLDFEDIKNQKEYKLSYYKKTTSYIKIIKDFFSSKIQSFKNFCKDILEGYENYKNTIRPEKENIEEGYRKYQEHRKNPRRTYEKLGFNVNMEPQNLEDIRIDYTSEYDQYKNLQESDVFFYKKIVDTLRSIKNFFSNMISSFINQSRSHKYEEPYQYSSQELKARRIKQQSRLDKALRHEYKYSIKSPFVSKPAINALSKQNEEMTEHMLSIIEKKNQQKPIK